MARPLRNILEKTTEQVPQGPLGFAGNGNLAGLVGFGGVTFINQFTPVPLGFKVKTHDVKDGVEDVEVHEYEIWSMSRDVAKFVALREAAGPNLNFLSNDSEVMRVDNINSRTGHSLWFVRVEVERTNTMEGEDVRESLA